MCWRHLCMHGDELWRLLRGHELCGGWLPERCAMRDRHARSGLSVVQQSDPRLCWWHLYDLLLKYSLSQWAVLLRWAVCEQLPDLPNL